MGEEEEEEEETNDDDYGQDQRDTWEDFKCFTCGGFDHRSQNCTAERTYLRCPYAQREQCKEVGGRWDPERMKWYTYQVDLRPFARWR